MNPTSTLAEKIASLSLARPKWQVMLPLFLALVLFYAYCLNAHGVLYSNVMVQDVIIFLDGIWRVQSGQVPHLDFASGLGLLNFYGPNLFMPLTGSIPKAFLAYYTVVVFFLTAIAVYLGVTRLRLALAIILLFYVAALAGGPSEFSLDRTFVSFAMFYNHFGWVAFLLSFLFLQKPVFNYRYLFFIDACLMALLLLFAFYTKATYFLVIVGLYGLAFAGYPKHFFKLMLVTASLASVVVLAVEYAHPGLHLAYFLDLYQMKNASAGINLDLASAFNDNARYLYLVLLIAILTQRIYVVGNYSFVRHSIIFIYIVLSSFFLFKNNAQAMGVPGMLGPVIALATFHAAIPEDVDRLHWVNTLGILFLIILFVYPELTEKQTSIVRYSREAKKSTYDFAVPEGLRDICFCEGTTYRLQLFIKNNGTINLEEFRDLSVMEAQHPPHVEIYQSEYMYTVAQGIFALQDIMKKYGEGPVINFDFSNPFSFVMHIKPPEGDFLWFHQNRNITPAFHPRASELFAQAKYVAVPKFPANVFSRRLLLRLYGNYLDKNYSEVADSIFWKFYLRND